MLDGKLRDSLQLDSWYHGSSRVIGIAQQNHLCTRRNRGGNVAGPHTKIILRIGWYGNGYATGKDNIGLIRDVARVGRDYLVAGINQGAHCQVYTLTHTEDRKS